MNTFLAVRPPVLPVPAPAALALASALVSALVPALVPALALGLPAAAHAQVVWQGETLSVDELRSRLARPESSASYTLLAVDGDARRFGRFGGPNDAGLSGFLDMDLRQRDDTTGLWNTLKLRRLGMPDSEARVGSELQGRWAVSAGWRRQVRDEPLLVTTGLAGEGTGTQLVSPTAPKRPLDLRQARETQDIAVRATVAEGWEARFTLRQDEERGARMFGRGTPSVMEFLTEPIDRTTTVLQTGLQYFSRQWQFTGGVSQSLFNNSVPVLRSSGINTTAFGSEWAMAMAPSNSAHQMYLTGGYTAEGGARTSFKLSRTDASQNQAFDPVFLRLAGTPDSLNGRVVTDLAYVDLSLRPTPGADVFASLRYEDRDDRTPLVQWLAATVPTASVAGVSGFNKPRSMTLVTGQVEGHYRLPAGLKLVASVQSDSTERQVPEPYRRMAMRAQVREATSRVELRGDLGDSARGSVAVLHAQRSGSEYLPDTYAATALSNQLASLLWADRQRDKVRTQFDWTPTETLSVQGLGEWSRDQYEGRALGPRRGTYRMAALDATWQPLPDWSLSLWSTFARNQAQQQARTDVTLAAASGGNTVWQADITTRSLASGLGLRGQLRKGLAAGADISVASDEVQNATTAIGGTGTLALPVLPTMHYRQQQTRLWGEAQLRPDHLLRLEVGSDRRRNDDWTWDGWVYNGSSSTAVALRTSDGTTVLSLPRENVVYARLSYRITFR